MWEFLAVDTIRTIVFVGLVIAVRTFLKVTRISAALKEVERRGDERTKEDQTGPWVRRG